MDSFPILSIITYLPVLGALAILFMARGNSELPKRIAVVAMSLSFLLSLVVTLQFERDATFQFTEHVVWLEDLGVSYFMGIDGISLLLVVLTTFIGLISVIWSWGTVKEREREYYIAILMLQTGMLGVFMALDLFVFYIFWEVMLIPMALLIGIWGSKNRIYAAMKFFLYTLFGSLLMLVGIIALYSAYFAETGVRTLNILELQNGAALGAFSENLQFWAFGAFFIAFAIKVPLFPFHTWLPDAHVESPTAGSVILAAVMLKMGGYGLLRFNLPLMPDASEVWAPFIIGLSVVGIIYGALVALVQPDLKKLIAYSSVSHMGFVTLGIFIMNLQGLEGAMMVMLAHGFNTGALFLLVGVIYERGHTRLIDAFGGLATPIGKWSGFFILFTFASIGLPGLSGFIGEFLVALGAYKYNPFVAFLAFSVVIFAAWYMLSMAQRVVWGRTWGQAPDPLDNELNDAERQELARLGNAHLEGGDEDAHLAVSGGDHTNQAEEFAEAHEDTKADGEGYPTHPGQINSSKWPDLNARELLCIVPLAVMTIAVGVYPKPIFDIMEPALRAVLEGAARVIGS